MIYVINIPRKKEDLSDEWFEELKKSEIGEINWIDFKTGDTEKVGSCITSFLNTEIGGVILYGMKKRGKDFEFSNIREPQKIIDEKLSKYLQHITDPPVNEVKMDAVKYNENNVIVIFIKPGEKFPYFFKGRVYLRMGSDSYPITDKRQIMALISYRMTTEKALKKFLTELNVIESDIKAIKNNIKAISGGRITEFVFSHFPLKIEETQIRELLFTLEPFLHESGYVDHYYNMLRKISMINQKIDVLTKNPSMAYHCEYGFGTLIPDTLEILKSMKTFVEGKIR